MVYDPVRMLFVKYHNGMEAIRFKVTFRYALHCVFFTVIGSEKIPEGLYILHSCYITKFACMKKK